MARPLKRPDYPAELVAELATILETTETNAVRRAELMRLSPVCGRCGGCGQYSFNQVDGTRCYGCGGSGHLVAKASELPAVLERAREAAESGELARYVDRVAAAAVAKAGQARLRAARNATAACQCFEGWTSHHLRDEEMPGNIAAIRAASRASYDASLKAEAAISAWQYPAKGTTPAERLELAVAARTAIEEALEVIASSDVAPTAELVEYIRGRQLASFEARKRGPWPPRADEVAPQYAGPVAELSS